MTKVEMVVMRKPRIVEVKKPVYLSKPEDIRRAYAPYWRKAELNKDVMTRLNEAGRNLNNFNRSLGVKK